MKTLLFVTTIYRIGERIYPIIPKLSKHFNIILFCTHEMARDSEYAGDINLKDKMKQLYAPYLTEIIENEGMKSYGDMFSDKYHAKMIQKLSEIKNIDVVLLDDCRAKPGMDKVYELFKSKNIIVFANHHGNSDRTYNIDSIKKTCDYCFVFGENESYNGQFIPAGLPSNDRLKNLVRKNKHILCIVNFIETQSSPHPINFGSNFVNYSGLLKLIDKTNLPLIIKLKSRLVQKYRISDETINYIYNSFPFEYHNKIKIIIDSDDDNKLISESKYVIGSPSTLALKSIQKKIPTVLIKDMGESGVFKNFSGLVTLDEKSILESLHEQETYPERTDDFIFNTIEGGFEYNSIDIYIKSLIGRC